MTEDTGMTARRRRGRAIARAIFEDRPPHVDGWAAVLDDDSLSLSLSDLKLMLSRYAAQHYLWEVLMPWATTAPHAGGTVTWENGSGSDRIIYWGSVETAYLSLRAYAATASVDDIALAVASYTSVGDVTHLRSLARALDIADAGRKGAHQLRSSRRKDAP